MDNDVKAWLYDILKSPRPAALPAQMIIWGFHVTIKTSSRQAAH
jgi:hypothetical protein